MLFNILPEQENYNMSPVELDERPVEVPSEDKQNTETPQYRISFGTFTLRVPISGD